MSVDKRVGKVILTHILPEKDIGDAVEYARAKYGLDMLIAYDGMCVEV